MTLEIALWSMIAGCAAAVWFIVYIAMRIE